MRDGCGCMLHSRSYGVTLGSLHKRLSQHAENLGMHAKPVSLWCHTTGSAHTGHLRPQLQPKLRRTSLTPSFPCICLGSARRTACCGCRHRAGGLRIHSAQPRLRLHARPAAPQLPRAPQAPLPHNHARARHRPRGQPLLHLWRHGRLPAAAGAAAGALDTGWVCVSFVAGMSFCAQAPLPPDDVRAGH